MISIRKSREPDALALHRESPYGSYENLGPEAKQALREALVRDQRGLCCYCTERIEPTENGMKIEHWAPQRPGSDQPSPGTDEPTPSGTPPPQEEAPRARQDTNLSYQNLLAACLGRQGRPFREQHCDSRKGNRSIRVDPRYPSVHPDQITYKTDGTICLDGLQDDIEERLNLNYKIKDASGELQDGYLKQNRKQRLASYLLELKRRKSEGDWDYPRLLTELEKRPDPPPQVGVILAWLRKRCRRAG